MSTCFLEHGDFVGFSVVHVSQGSAGPALGMFEVFDRTGPQSLGGRNFGPYKN